MRKCTPKQNKDTTVYSSDSDIMCTPYSEFRIDANKNCYAKLHNSYGYNFPLETSMQKVGDSLFYAGGNDYNFKIIDFEIYGVEE